MNKVFISHSSKDKPFVRKLKEDLRFNEIDTWVDEDELKVGDNLYDSLMQGIDNSTHFLIVLSNNMQNSDWVQKELTEAFTLFDQQILKKIIPVVLRKTNIPLELNTLFRADFSAINFSLNGDKVFSTGDAYHIEFNKIINAIKQSDSYKLLPSEKNLIVKETDKLSGTAKQTKIAAYYEIAGYSNNESRKQTIIRLKQQYKNTPLSKIATESVIPVILPNLLKPLFTDLKLGDKLYFPVDNKENLEAHFCGFSQNNSRIIVPSKIRTPFGIKARDIVLVEVNGENSSITFID